MASISTDKGGNRRILFLAPNGKRPSIRLGKVSQRTAEGIKYCVEQLLQALRWQQPITGDLAEWVNNLDMELAKKLARVGLIPDPEAKPTILLGPFLTDYLAGQADLKPATKIVRGHVVRDLTQYFGKSRDVATILAGEADDFKQSLVKRGLASTTIHKRLQVARSFFHAMLRRKLIAENPFEGVKAAAIGIRDRQRFVTRPEIELVLAACPDHHWRAIVALSRYGGLRCPSEVLSLRWQDVDWLGERIIVTSPKTEHAGKASRTIPLFPELLAVLNESWDLAPKGAVYVVDERFRKAAVSSKGWLNINLRTTFEKIVARSGLTIWARPFHNLRASRETELLERFPLQVVTDWLGNTPKIAMRHYLMTTEEHFSAAVRPNVIGTDKAAQNPAQYAHATAGIEGDGEQTAHEKPRHLPGLTEPCIGVQAFRVAGAGFEPTTSRL